MHHSTARILMHVSCIVYLVLAILFVILHLWVTLAITTVLWIVIYLVLAFFARCPHCGRFPGRSYITEHFCPGCGEPLD